MFGFSRKPAQTIVDPVFGPLTLNRRFGWEGTVPSPVNGEAIRFSSTVQIQTQQLRIVLFFLDSLKALRR